MNRHSGNLLNQVTFEEHDGDLNAKKVNIVASNATVFAVVNTGASGNVTLDDGSLTGIVGNVTLSDSRGFIGLATVKIGTNVNTNIGLVTVDGGRIGVVGNVTLSNPNTYIGLTTTTLGLGDRYIGLVTSTQVGLVTTVNVGLQTLAPSPNYIGLASVNIGGGNVGLSGNVTLDDGSLTGIIGNLTLSDSKGFIGLITVVQASSVRSITGNVTVQAVDLDIRNLSSAQDNIAVIGNVTLSDSKGFIGLTTTVVGSALPAGANFIGLVTIVGSLAPAAGNVTLDDGSLTGLVAGVNSIGFASVTPVAAWPDPKGYIGLVTITGSLAAAAGNITLDAGSKTQIIGNITLSDPKGFIGLVTIVGSLSAAAGNITLDGGSRTGILGNVTIQDGGNSITVDGNVGIIGNLTLSDPKGFIGLVTAITKNGGTTKTLIPKNISFAQASISTIAVPSNTFNITSIILNSNATVGLRIKSGATYLIGNVSISTMLNPGGGLVQHGTPDSPVYKGLAGAAAIVVEKEDLGQVAEIAGHLMYFDE